MKLLPDDKAHAASWLPGRCLVWGWSSGVLSAYGMSQMLDWTVGAFLMLAGVVIVVFPLCFIWRFGFKYDELQDAP